MRGQHDVILIVRNTVIYDVV